MWPPAGILQAAYAWTNTEITRSAIENVGNDLPNAPQNSASIWTRYRLQNGRLAGTMFVAGIVRVSDRFLAANNLVIAPADTRLDLSGAYEFEGQHVNRCGDAQRHQLQVRDIRSRYNIVCGPASQVSGATVDPVSTRAPTS